MDKFELKITEGDTPAQDDFIIKLSGLDKYIGGLLWKRTKEHVEYVANEHAKMKEKYRFDIRDIEKEEWNMFDQGWVKPITTFNSILNAAIRSGLTGYVFSGIPFCENLDLDDQKTEMENRIIREMITKKRDFVQNELRKLYDISDLIKKEEALKKLCKPLDLTK